MDKEIIKTIGEINECIYQKEEKGFTIPHLIYETDGIYYEAVKYANEYIWSSEEDDREFDENTNEYECYEIYFIRKIKEIVKTITRIDFDEILTKYLLPEEEIQKINYALSILDEGNRFEIKITDTSVLILLNDEIVFNSNINEIPNDWNQYLSSQLKNQKNTLPF